MNSPVKLGVGVVASAVAHPPGGHRRGCQQRRHWVVPSWRESLFIAPNKNGSTIRHPGLSMRTRTCMAWVLSSAGATFAKRLASTA